MNHPPSGFGRRASQGSSGSPVYSGECDRDTRHAGQLQLRYMDLAAHIISVSTSLADFLEGGLHNAPCLKCIY
jgi:hypothetical protein